MKPAPFLTGRSLSFSPDNLIVSKTDPRGIITYVNDTFMEVSGFRERELLGAPHNVIRHPAMPRCIFKLLWETVQSGEEIFAYVLNRAKNGDEYWVLAHVTPSFDPSGNLIGYHSNRRSPYLDALPAVKALYAALLTEESTHLKAADAAYAGRALLDQVLERKKMSYEAWVFSLSRETSLAASSQ